MASFPKRIITPLSKKTLLTTEKVTASEEVDKGTKNLDDKKEAVVATPLSKKTLLTTEKVTRTEEADKDTNILDDMKEAVFTILSKDLDNFEGQCKVSTGWFNLDNEFLRRKFSTLKPNFYFF